MIRMLFQILISFTKFYLSQVWLFMLLISSFGRLRLEDSQLGYMARYYLKTKQLSLNVKP
jgi:hypothetical protein